MKQIPKKSLKNCAQLLKKTALLTFILQMTACAMPTMQIGDKSAKTEVTGSAGGDSSKNANSAIPRCSQSLGTMAVNENQQDPWFLLFRQNTQLQSIVPLIRLMAQQSNCFVIVERGQAGMSAMMAERALNATGEMRKSSKMGKGQMVAADYTLVPSVTFSENTAGGIGGITGQIGGGIGLIGSLVGSFSKKEASVTLILNANRSGVQLAAAEGSASKMDFAGLGGLMGGSGGGALGSYTNTPEKKVLVAAFIDAYAQIVDAVKSYKAQSVSGGLGTGGTLKVQGE